MKKRSVVVVGGGAAGMMAAIMSGREGAAVTIVERMNRIGKKILATGNGRCNLTNADCSIKRFHGNNPKFALGALNNFDANQAIQFFEELGIAHKVEAGGKVYPFSDQAAAVLDVLRFEIERLGIKVICEKEVVLIRKKDNAFVVQFSDTDTIKTDRVIVTTGGKAAPKFGCDGSGYEIAKKLGHSITDVFPALVQIRVDAWFLKQVKGVKVQGKATLYYKEKMQRQEAGEILFTEDGISGPPVFQLSRKVAQIENNNQECIVCIDLFPESSIEELIVMLQIRSAYQPQKTAQEFLIGLLNKRLIAVVLKEAKVDDIHKKCSQLSTKELKRIVQVMKQWRLKAIGTRSWMNAQVTAGGINTKEIDPKTMESKKCQGLYWAGEVIDIDGDCGGFNLQWAWASGFIAGVHAAK